MSNPLTKKNMSRFHNRNFELLEPYDAKVSCTVLRGESIRKDADLLDKRYYDALKSVSNLVRSARKVQQCILLVGEISDIYVDGYRRMVGDENFTPAELAAIAAGYARIIEESAGELQDIVNPTDMSLTDKDRIDVVQRVYGVLRRHRDLARYYTRKNISISLLRAARKRDMEGVLSLYGTDEQRYW